MKVIYWEVGRLLSSSCKKNFPQFVYTFLAWKQCAKACTTDKKGCTVGALLFKPPPPLMSHYPSEISWSNFLLLMPAQQIPAAHLGPFQLANKTASSSPCYQFLHWHILVILLSSAPHQLMLSLAQNWHNISCFIVHFN